MKIAKYWIIELLFFYFLAIFLTSIIVTHNGENTIAVFVFEPLFLLTILLLCRHFALWLFCKKLSSGNIFWPYDTHIYLFLLGYRTPWKNINCFTNRKFIKVTTFPSWFFSLSISAILPFLLLCLFTNIEHATGFGYDFVIIPVLCGALTFLVTLLGA